MFRELQADRDSGGKYQKGNRPAGPDDKASSIGPIATARHDHVREVSGHLPTSAFTLNCIPASCQSSCTLRTWFIVAFRKMPTREREAETSLLIVSFAAITLSAASRSNSRAKKTAAVCAVTSPQPWHLASSRSKCLEEAGPSHSSHRGP
eukprot:5107132-Prymnesium_polylepis.2